LFGARWGDGHQSDTLLRRIGKVNYLNVTPRVLGVTIGHSVEGIAMAQSSGLGTTQTNRTAAGPGSFDFNKPG